MIERFGSGGAYEAVVGYSRTVRAGELVLVLVLHRGGRGRRDGRWAGPGRAGARRARRLRAGLALAGARLTDVVRTRMYVTDIARWADVGRVHGERFGACRPVSTMLEVAALIDPRMLVEIEVEAYSPR